VRNLTIVFHDAGGGHRNAALALKAVLEGQQYPWNVRLLNLQELLEPIDLVQRATGHRLQDGYNLLLRKGWTRLTPQLLVLLQCTIRLQQPRIVRILRNFWAQNPTDLVVSVIPHFNACLAESIRREMPRTAFVTVLTDLADHPFSTLSSGERQRDVSDNTEGDSTFGHLEARLRSDPASTTQRNPRAAEGA